MSDRVHRHARGHGLYLLSLFESAGAVSPIFESEVRELFAEHGLEDVTPEETYPVERIAAAFEAVVEEMGETPMRKGGRHMGRDVPWPAGVETPHDGLATIDGVHQDASSLSPDSPSEIARPCGEYTYQRVDERTARVGITGRYPYPTVMAEGVFLGIVDDLGGVDPRTSQVPPRGREIAAWEITWE